MGAIEDIGDNYSQGQMIALGVVFMIIPIIAVAMRLWSKTLGQRGIQWDDHLVVAALLFAIGCCVVQLIAAIDGQLGQHQTVDAEGMPILDDPGFVIYEKCKFAVNILSTVGLGFVKASILVLYMNIFFGKPFRIASQVVIGIVAAWTVSFFFANLFTCYPISPFIEPFYENNCVNGLALWYSMAFSDVIVDFMILFMPVPMVLKLQLPWKQKLGVLAMFFLGATVCAFSITRALIYVHVGEVLAIHFNDETYYTSPVFFWCVIELSTAVVSACLPTYRPIWLYLRGHPVKNTSSGSRGYGSSGYGRYGYGSSTGGHRSGHHRSGAHQLASTTDFDFKDDIALTTTPGLAVTDTEVHAARLNSSGHMSLGQGIMVEQSFHTQSRPLEHV